MDSCLYRRTCILIPRLHGAKIIQNAIWIASWIAMWIAIQKMYPFTRDIHFSIQQSASHCSSLFRHCYIAIHLISGFKLSKFHDPDSNLDRDLDNFAPCKWGI